MFIHNIRTLTYSCKAWTRIKTVCYTISHYSGIINSIVLEIICRLFFHLYLGIRATTNVSETTQQNLDKQAVWIH